MLASVALAPMAGHASGTTVARPLAGHWKFEKAFSQGMKSGSFTVTKSRRAITHFTVKPMSSGTSCSKGTITVKGPLALHKTAFQESEAAYWSVAKRDGGSVKVTARQDHKTVKGTLQLGISPRNGTTHPVKYVDGVLMLPNCTLILGGSHG
jgi:hypothetical protein